MKAPALTKEQASTIAWLGPAQKPLASDPVALTRPAISAAALAKLPPPLWFISPQASSEQSITYSTSSFDIPAFFTAYNKDKTAVALFTRFSCITSEFKFTSIS